MDLNSKNLSAIAMLKRIEEFFDHLHKVGYYPHAGQVEIFRKLRSENIKNFLLQFSRSWGKLLPLDTLIPTPDRGFVPMSHIKVGDVVFDENGKHCNVIGESRIDPSPELYRITFSDGATIEACKDHQWLTTTKEVRASQKNNTKPTSRQPIKQPKVVTTKQIKETLTWGKYKELNHHIPCNGGVDLPAKNLLIHPYVLGIWLGDGHASCARISGIDTQVWQEIRSCGYGVTESENQSATAHGLSTQLMRLGLKNNKFVPEDYLWGSRQQRLDFLHGLMDTDGTCDKTGFVSFCNTNKSISDAVYHLMWSLGVKARRFERIPRCHGKPCARAYYVAAQTDVPMFRLARKLVRQKNKTRGYSRSIKSVEKIESRPGKCISVDSPNKLFLAGKSFIVTHNSTTLGLDFVFDAGTIPNSKNYIIAPTRVQAYEIYWASNFLKTIIPPDWLIKGEEGYSKSELRFRFKNGSFIKLDGADNEDALRGYKPTRLGCDEFQAWKKEAWQAMEPNLLAHDAVVIKIGTPPDIRNHFIEEGEYIQKRMKMGDRRVYYAEKDIYSCPRYDVARLNQMRDAYIARGEEAVWKREYLAKFIPGGASAILPQFDHRTNCRPRDWILEQLKLGGSKVDYYTISDPSGTRHASLFFALNRASGHVYVIDEVVETDPQKLSVGQLTPRIKAMESRRLHGDVFRVYDEAAKLFQIEMAQIGMYYAPTRKKQNDKSNNISLVRDMFIKGLLIVAEECKHTIDDIYGYHYDERGKIVKVKDDCLDCILYMAGETGYSIDLAPTNFEPDPDRPRFHTPYQDYISRGSDELIPSIETRLEMDFDEVSEWDSIN